jgi:hypothetical protein
MLVRALWIKYITTVEVHLIVSYMFWIGLMHGRWNIPKHKLSKKRIILFYWQVHKLDIILGTQNLKLIFYILTKQRFEIFCQTIIFFEILSVNIFNKKEHWTLSWATSVQHTLTPSFCPTDFCTTIPSTFKSDQNPVYGPTFFSILSLYLLLFNHDKNS